MKKITLLLICAVVLIIGSVLAGCKSMQVDYLEQDTVEGPKYVRQYRPINPREITVWAVYKDGKRKVHTVSPSQIIFDSSRPGPQTVKIRVAREEVSFQTEVVPLNGLTIDSPPRKSLFKIGEDADPAWPGLEIRGTWAQLGSEQIPVNSCEITGYMKNQAGRQTITIAFGGLRTTFDIDVRSMSGIQIIDLPKKYDYYQGEPLDLSGLRVLGLWGDGIPNEELSISMADVTGFNTNNRGIQHLTISKNGRIVNFDVEIWGLVSLDLEKPPTKTDYVVGQQFDLTGILIKGTYMGSTTARREGDGYIDVSRLRYNGYDPNRVGKQQRITVWVDGLNAIYVNFFINVDPAPVSAVTPAPEVKPGDLKIDDVGSGGGRVFYYNARGFTNTHTSRICHYLEAVLLTQPNFNSTKEWQLGNNDISGTATAIGTGRKNTAIIIAHSSQTPAAQLCADYRGGGKDDWFLPSKDELNELYRNRADVSLILDDFFHYSSSSQASNSQIWVQYFNTGRQIQQNKNGQEGYGMIVAVRAF